MLKKIFLFFSLGLIIIFLIINFLKNESSSLETKNPKIELAIEKGIQFITQRQEPYGEIAIDLCLDENLEKCLFASTPFGAAQVLYSLHALPREKTENIIKKGLIFLQEEEEKEGVWRYFSSRYKFPREKMPIDEPDLETMALVSFVLQLYETEFSDNYKLFQERKNEKGLFYTWLKGEANPEFFIFPDEEVDCVINANVLLYLGESDQAVCSYLIDAVRKKEEWCSLWYPSRFSLFYSISRAFKYGAECLGEEKETIIKEVLASQEQSGVFRAELRTAFYGPKLAANELETALALNVLLNFGYKGKEIEKAVEYLLKNQRQDGSWARDLWFVGLNRYSEGVYFGSEELTTALAIEALHNYYSNNH